MNFRCILTKVALNLAHHTMQFGSIKSTSLLPKCYLKRQDMTDDLKELKKDYIVIDGNKFTYWFDKGDHGPIWDSWTAQDLDSLILEYYKDQINGEVSLYPTIMTAKKIGPIHNFIKDGNVQKWNKERARVEKLLSRNLNRYVNGAIYKCLKSLI